jgi:GNAT superfamily N-acetyltransferase
MIVRRLKAEDSRSGFSCGNEDLDRFFRRYALINQETHYIGTTYVGEQDGDLVGFFTVSPCQIEIDRITQETRGSLPRYPLPALRLARLGVSVSRQGQGVDSQLLRHVFAIALELAERVGCFGVLVDAKPEAVEWYRKFGFEPLRVLEGESNARPRQTEMFLVTAEIQAALDEVAHDVG